MSENGRVVVAEQKDQWLGKRVSVTLTGRDKPEVLGTVTVFDPEFSPRQPYHVTFDNNEGGWCAEDEWRTEDELTLMPPSEEAKPKSPPVLTIEALQARLAQQEQVCNTLGNAVAGQQLYQEWIAERGKLIALRELLALLTTPPE